jgi:hypothetical protein
MRKVFLALNYISLLFACGAWFYANKIAALSGPLNVTELDRNGVFNEEKLAEYDSKLAENLRYNVGFWIQEDEEKTAVFYSFIIGGMAILNIFGFHFSGFPCKTISTPNHAISSN